MSIIDTLAQGLGFQLSRHRFENAKLASPEIQEIIAKGRDITPEAVEEMKQKWEAIQAQKKLVKEYCRYGREGYLGQAEIDAELLRTFLPIEAEANAIRASAIVDAEKKRRELLKVAQADRKYLRGVM